MIFLVIMCFGVGINRNWVVFKWIWLLSVFYNEENVVGWVDIFIFYLNILCGNKKCK